MLTRAVIDLVAFSSRLGGLPRRVRLGVAITAVVLYGTAAPRAGRRSGALRRRETTRPGDADTGEARSATLHVAPVR
jgi:hypothetical protein